MPPIQAEADNFPAQTRAFFGLALPMIISRLGLAAMGIVDGLMLAHRNTQQLALHGLGEALAGRAIEIGMAFVMAGMALAAQARSGGDTQQQRVGQVWRLALLMAVGAGVLGALFGALGTPLLRLAGQPPLLAEGAGTVVFILCLGMLPAMAAIATAGLLEAIGRPGMVAVAIVLANLLNVGLNMLLIDGIFGGPPLGAVGVAWSTTIVRALLAVALLVYALRLPQRVPYGLRLGYSRQDWSEGREQRARGLSAAGSVSVLAILGLGLPMMAGWLGEQSLAELTALFLVMSPCMVVAWGLSDTVGLRIAAVLGHEGGQGRLTRSGLQQAGLSVALLLALALLWLAAPASVMALFTPDAALLQRVLQLLPLGLAAVLGDGLSFVLVNGLRSLGELRRPFWLQSISALLLLPLAWSMAAPWGADWGLAGLLAAQAGVATLRNTVLALLYLRVARRIDAQSRTLPAAAASAQPQLSAQP